MYELFKWIDEYVYYYLFIIVMTFFISCICSSISEVEIDEKKSNIIGTIGNIIYALTITSMIVVMLLYIVYGIPMGMENRTKYYNQQYIHSITDFDTSAPEGVYVVKKYKNIEDFKEYKSYGENAGYTLYKVDESNRSSIEVTFRKDKK